MENTTQIAPLLAKTVADKPLNWFYPNVFVRGELNGIQGTPGDGSLAATGVWSATDRRLTLDPEK